MEKVAVRFSPIIGVAATLIVIVFLQMASTILVPILVAMVLAVLGSNPLIALRRRHVPNTVATVLVMVLMGAVIALFGYFIVHSLDAMSREFHHYKTLFGVKYAYLESIFAQYGIVINVQMFDIDTVKAFLTSTLKSLGTIVTGTLVVLFLLLFMLLEIGMMEHKVRQMWAHDSRLTQALREIIKSVNHYLAIKTATSLATGLSVYLMALVAGIDFALFLGVLAFVLNFIPTVGSIVAAIPGIFLAWMALELDVVVIVIIAYLVINIGISNFIEPKFMGEGLGLSTLVVFISLLFWGWVFGIVGMLFSAILTMVVKIMLAHSPRTQWLAVMMSNKS
ncbi:MAG: hypothetical protein KU37_06005 [Sulfuricurvum sp. PC08-66]|nr:MAG: hypothetical protein KU37_06005 [Sulfuricurvum sp. PC08-66]